MFQLHWRFIPQTRKMPLQQSMQPGCAEPHIQSSISPYSEMSTLLISGYTKLMALKSSWKDLSKTHNRQKTDVLCSGSFLLTGFLPQGQKLWPSLVVLAEPEQKRVINLKASAIKLGCSDFFHHRWIFIHIAYFPQASACPSFIPRFRKNDD